jgi:hypothetical protein
MVLLSAICAGIVFGTATVPDILSAQAGGPSEIQTIATPPSSTAGAELATSNSIGPTVETAGFHTPSTASRVITEQEQEPAPHVGRGLAMTVAGVVLVGVGAAVKGGAGTAIAFGGGALALYGLYHWIE